MCKCKFLLSISVLAVVFSSPSFCLQSVEGGPERRAKNNSAASLIENIAAGRAFSFVYDGKRSQDSLPQWKRTESAKTLSGGRRLHVTTYLDPATGLEVTSEITMFSEAHAVECILRMKNTGLRNTPIIENILPLDLTFVPFGTGKIVMHYAHGSVISPEDFLPVEQEVATGTKIDLDHYGMKGDQQVDSQAPYFDLEWQGGGLIAEVGWSGQWAAHVSGASGRRTTVRAGQERTHLQLHPGESIRTPRILSMQWEGNDRALGHNQLRRLLLAHYAFRIDGQIAVPPVSNAGNTGSDFNGANEQNQLDLIHHTDAAGIEAYWMDAAWFEGGWPNGVGNWIPDPKKFPRGLKPVEDAAHARGLKSILWFEPGRVTNGSRIAIEHPEWVLHRVGEGNELGGLLGGLFNYGDPAALHWMTESMSEKIDAWGIDIFRNDSNVCPVPFWSTADAPNRQGITENHWVEGLYKLWDNLLRAHPKLLIDNANWRITGPDIEAMSRSVGSFTRSELDGSRFQHLESAAQMQTQGFSPWVPISSGNLYGFDPYAFRSGATMGGVIGDDLNSFGVSLNQEKDAIQELKSLRPFWFGDYYPLTEISLDEHAWSGWEFYRPDLGAGFAVLFRRSLNTQASFEASLHGVDPTETYDVTFAPTYKITEERVMTGEQLKHLRVEIGTAPGSMLIRFKPARVRTTRSASTTREE